MYLCKIKKGKICIEFPICPRKGTTGFTEEVASFTSMFHIFFGMGRSRANVVNMTRKVIIILA